MWREPAPTVGVEQDEADTERRMDKHGDWELIDQARGGDMDAFAELVKRYQTPIVHFCQRMVGVPQEAEDLAQDTFVRVYRYLPRLRPDAKFSTVLFGVARNLTLNFIRDSKRRGRDLTRSIEQADGRNLELEDHAARPDRVARVREIEELLERAMAELSAEHREVIVLRETQGLDYDAISEITRCRKGTVKSRLARAREQLRLRLLELGGDML